MKKISLVFGTRPEAIKLCPLIKELKSRRKFRIETILSGQHREMLDGILERFGLAPDFNMNIMTENQSLSHITEKVMGETTRLFVGDRPDLVLVHGDTTTAFAAALASFYLKIPIGHVEAGLRTHNVNEPFPEEFNRRSIDTMASLFFAPTENAKGNLLAEGISENRIFVTGNTGIDALMQTVKRDFSHPLVCLANESPTLLLTAHRRENHGEPLLKIYEAIRRIALDYEEIRIICPIHKNPAVSKTAYSELGKIKNIILCGPLESEVFQNLMARCRIILTDSGGVQEEAAALGIPTLVLRSATERPEGVDTGVLKTVGCDPNAIYNEFTALYKNHDPRKRSTLKSDVYGDGRASLRIADIIEKNI